MAEGFARYFGGSRVLAESAGTVAGAMDPYCQWAMNEAGIDIAVQAPDLLKDKDLSFYDHIVAMSTGTNEESLGLPESASIHRWEIPDPADVRSGPEDEIKVFRAVRNQIEKHVKDLLATLLNG
jgi:arsenate reductase